MSAAAPPALDPAANSGLLAAILDNIQDAVYYTDEDCVIRYWSPAAERLTGYTAARMTGARCSDVPIHVDARGQANCGAFCPLQHSQAHGRHHSRLWIQHAAGHRFPADVTAIPLLDAAGHNRGTVEIFRDASAELSLLRRARELEEQSLLDPLTGLGNRRFFDRVLRQSWDAWRRYSNSFGLALFEIDQLEIIKARHGGESADTVLRVLARSLSSALRSFDFLGRHSDRVFVAIIQSVASEDLVSVAQRSNDLARKCSIACGGDVLHVTLSSAVASAEECESPDELLELAGTRLLCARRAGPDLLIGPPTLSRPPEAA